MFYEVETDKNSMIAGDLNTLLAVIDRANKQKTSKEILALDDADQMDMIDI